MVDQAERIVELIKKRLADDLNEVEKIELNEWVSRSEENRLWMKELLSDIPVEEYMKEFYLSDEQAGWNKIAGRLNSTKKVRMSAKTPLWVSAAAALFVIVLAVVYLYWIKPSNIDVTTTTEKPGLKDDIPPGSDRAILTLSDGSTIVLDNAKNGELTKEGNTKIIKPDSGQIVYNIAKEKSSSANALYNTITTPRGGQYKLILPDSTKVWLNAASSLRFPVVFAGGNRVVELKGEAYFEVAPQPRPFSTSGKGSKVPFIVKANEMEVTVLGTHFNVMAYEDEPAVKTTLLEGSVKVSKGPATVSIKPGQKATLTKGKNYFKVEEANTSDEMAWKNGYISFRADDIETVFRKVGRWYDVDIEYEGPVKDAGRLVGDVRRTENISKVLWAIGEIFKEKLRIKLEGRKIIVTPIEQAK